MTYLTDFNTVQIEDNIIGNANINITGNIQANNTSIDDTLTVGNLSFNPDETTGNVVVTLTGSDVAVELQAPTVVQSSMTISSLGLFSLPGGSGSQFLTTNGNGVLSWAVPQGQGSGVVGGGVQALQVNNGYGFGGDVGNLYANISVDATDPNAAITTVTQLNVNVPLVMGTSSGANGIIATNVEVYTAAANLFINGGSAGQVLYSNGSSSVYWANLPVNPPGGGLGALQFDNGNGGFAGTANLAMSVDSNVVTTVTMRSNSFVIDAGNVDTTISTDNGNLSIQTAGNLSLPAIANVKIGGGSNNFVVTTDSAGNLSWTAKTVLSIHEVNTSTYSPANPLVVDIVTVSTAGPVTIILPEPAAEFLGTYLHIKDIWGGGRADNPITISVSGGDTIDGQSNVQITGDFNSIQIAQVDLTSWGVL